MSLNMGKKELTVGSLTVRPILDRGTSLRILFMYAMTLLEAFDGFMDLRPRGARVRLGRWWYETISRMVQDGNLAFMNYSYALPVSGSGPVSARGGIG